MKSDQRPVRATLILGGLGGLSFIAAGVLGVGFGLWPWMAFGIAWCLTAAYALALVRWSGRSLTAVLFPLLVLGGIGAVLPRAGATFVLALGVLSWIRSGVCYPRPVFQALFRVSPFGVVDDRGQRPDYGTCVILLKYLLMCPLQVPCDEDWIAYRDFSDAGQAQNIGLADYAATGIAKRYAGGLERLKAAVRALGGRAPAIDYPYDLAAVVPALPRIPILFLFNDADEQFPARASILYQRRAAHFLDAECRVMVDWYLLEHLKQAEPNLTPV